MKLVLTAASLLLSTAVMAKGLPSGEYTGTGQWQSSDGKTGSYAAETSIVVVSTEPTKIQVISKYVADGYESQHAFVAISNESSSWDVFAPGAARIGSGRCSDHECRFNLELFGMEEVFHFSGNQLQTWRSQTTSGQQIIWKESLSKQH